MYRSFDAYGNFETVELILCQPTGKEVQTMSHAMNVKVTPRFGCFWDLEFDVPKRFIVDGNDYEVPYYELLVRDRQVKIENYGVFTIDNVDIDHEDVKEIKHITCSTIDSLLSKTNLVAFSGVYKLFDPLNMDKTIMGLFNSTFDNEWKISCTDSSLWEIHRDYDISDMTWYEFLMNKVSNDFQCVFEFDTLTKTIIISTVENAIHKTDIIVSDENLLKKISITPITDGIKTKLTVYGADGISIMEVNPLGTNELYNLSYYCDEKLMMLSKDTIQAYRNWETLYKIEEVNYGNIMKSIKTKNGELIKLNVELVELKNELDRLEAILSTKLNGEDTSTITSQINQKKTEIKQKETQITSKKAEIDNLKAQKISINNKVNFKKAFTSEQWKEVYAIIRNTSGSYINDAFVKTDAMTEVDVQEKCEQLLKLGKEVLDKSSKPKYNFSCDMVNFFTHKDFDVYAKQLRLGCQVTLMYDDKVYYPILLEYPLDFNDISKSQVKLSDNLRMSTDDYNLADILSGVNNTITSNGMNQGTWSDYINSGDKDRVNNLYYDAMDLANKKVISTTGQAPLIDHTGIRGRKLMDDGSFSPKQTWMTNNGLYMSDSNWTKPAKVAIGEIEVGGVSYYGIAGDLIIGNLMMTERLVISNQNNTVTIDGQGFTATNASITLNRKDGRGSTVINPTDGISISSMINNKLEKVFFVDGSGNLNFKGNLTGASGTFSGTINGSSFVGGSISINSRFTVDNVGNCVAKSLTADNATFRSCNLSDSTFKAGSIEGSSINIGGGNFTVNSYGRVYASDIHIAGNSTFEGNMTGGSINIRTDATIGSQLYLSETGALSGISFGSRSRITNSNGFMYLSADSIYLDSRTIKIGDVWADEILTKSSLPTSTAGKEVAKHNHGIPDGTKLAVVGGGSVTWSSYSGDWHYHEI